MKRYAVSVCAVYDDSVSRFRCSYVSSLSTIIWFSEKDRPAAVAVVALAVRLRACVQTYYRPARLVTHRRRITIRR